MSKRLRSQSRERIAVVSAAIASHCRLRRPAAGVGAAGLGGDVMVIGSVSWQRWTDCRKPGQWWGWIVLPFGLPPQGG